MKINKVGWTYFSIIEDFLTKEECYDIINACQGTWNYTQLPAGVYPNGWTTESQKRYVGNPFEVQFKNKIDKMNISDDDVPYASDSTIQSYIVYNWKHKQSSGDES